MEIPETEVGPELKRLRLSLLKKPFLNLPLKKRGKGVRAGTIVPI